MVAIYKKAYALLNRKERYSFFILMVMMIIEAMLEMIGIGVIPVFVSVIAFPGELSKIPLLQNLGLNEVGFISSNNMVYWASAFLLLFFTFKTAYTINSSYWKVYFASNRALKLSERLYKAYLSAPYSFHLEHGTPELMRNINTESALLANQVLLPLINIISQGVIIFGIVIILSLSVPFSVLLWLFVFLLVAAAITASLSKRINLLGKEAQQNRALLIQTVKDGLEGVKEIKLMQRIGYFTDRFISFFTRMLKIQLIIRVIQSGLPSIIELVTMAGLLGVIVMLFAKTNDPTSIIPIVTGFSVALVRMKGAVRSAMHDFTAIRHSSVSLDVVYDDLNNLEVNESLSYIAKGIARRDSVDSQGQLIFNEEIVIKNLWFKYQGAENFTLKDINLSIKKGESIGFVGSTGAGKSTLLDIVLGLLQPTMGEILVDDQNIQGNLESWQLNMGYIPQLVFLINGTITENIALGVDASKIESHRLNQAVEVASLVPLLNKLPSGLETVVGERGVRLSGGERQRIAIARALYLDPDVLAMDEATSALDNLTEAEIIKAVDAIKGDRTVLLIAHRLSTVRHCDRIVFLKDGVVSAIGSFHELIDKNPEFRLMASTVE